MPRTVTVPAAKAALLTRIRALNLGGDVFIDWGLQAETPDQRERVYLARTVNYDRPRRRGTIRGESYGLELIVEVHGGGETAQETEERMWTIIATIEADLMQGRTLEVADVVEVTPSDELVYAYTDGWIARNAVRVDVQAIL
jgi:hypothetical protein